MATAGLRRCVRRLSLGTAIADLRRLAISGTSTTTTAQGNRGDNGPQRARSLTEAQLSDVALGYITAYESGSPVTTAVAERFGVTRSTAAKRIVAARAAGLLEGIGMD